MTDLEIDLALTTPQPFTVRKNEHVDSRVVDFILLRLSVEDFALENRPSPDELGMLKAAVKAWAKKKGEVLYTFGKVKNGEQSSARLYAVKAQGLQSFKREVRSLLAHQFYWDVDMENAQPVFLVQLAKKKGWACPKVQEYCDTRADKLRSIQDQLGCDRAKAKEICTALVFGSGRDYLNSLNLPEFFNAMFEELRTLRDLAWQDQDYAQLRRSKSNGDPKASLLAIVLQTIERKCLMAMDAALASKERYLATLIHDGGLVLKLDGEAEFPQDLLRFCETWIAEKEEYKVTLTVKPMNPQIAVRDFVPNNSTYKTVQERFQTEEGVAKVIEKAMFSQKTAQGIQLVSKEHILCAYEDWYYTETATKDGLMKDVKIPFISQWLRDEEKRCWRTVSFWPSHKERPGILNTFSGFAYESLLTDDSISQPTTNNMALLEELFDNVSGGYKELLWKLVAYMLQFPEERLKVCVVLKGASGVGKDTALQWIGKLFGKKTYANIKQAERDIFGSFNGMMKEAVFVHLEEANSAVFMDPKVSEMFKALITSGNLPINEKHKGQQDSFSYANFWLSTNRDLAVKVEADDRRFWFLQSRELHKSEGAYWSAMYAAIQEPSVIKAKVQELLALDLSGFSPIGSRPETMLLDITRRKNIDLHIKFLNEVAFEVAWVAENSVDSPIEFDSASNTLKISTHEFHRRYCSWVKDQEIRAITLQVLDDKLKMSDVLGTPGERPMHKQRHRFGVKKENNRSYIIDLGALKSWIRTRKLVIDTANDKEELN